MPAIFNTANGGVRDGNFYAAMPTATSTNLAAGTGGWSFACWVRQSAFGEAGGGAMLIEMVDASNAISAKVHLGIFGGASIRVQFGNPSGNQNADFNSMGLVNHEWIHVAVVATGAWNGSTTVKCYINGTETALNGGGGGTGTAPSPTGVIVIGGSQVNTNRDMMGMMHKVGAWNATLTDDEIARLAGKGYRAHNVSEIQPTKTFIDCPYDTTMNNVCDATAGTPGARTSGSATLSNRYIGDIPGIGYWFKARNASNTNSGGRIASAPDYGGSGITASEGTNSGPVYWGQGGSGDYYASSASDFDRYLDNAASGGLYFNARRATILSFGAAISTQAFPSRFNPRMFMSLGNPATTDGGKAELWASADGFPVGGEASSTARTTGNQQRWDASNARLMGAVFKTTGVDAWADDKKTTGSTPCTAATGNGFRLFAALGNTRTNVMEGHIYDIIFYQRALDDTEIATIRAAFRDNDATAGIGQSYFSDATGLITATGSSSTYGLRADWGAGFFRLIQSEMHDRIVYNFGRSGGYQSHIRGLIDSYMLASDTLALFPKSKRSAIFQPFGNDNDGNPNFGYGGPNITYSQVLTNYQADVDSMLAQYTKVWLWETGPRGALQGGYTDSTSLTNRENARIAFFNDLTGVSRLYFDTIPQMDPRQQAGATTYDKVIAVVTNTAVYHTDQIHMNSSGFNLIVAKAIAAGIADFVPVTITSYLPHFSGVMQMSLGINDLNQVVGFNANMVSSGYSLSNNNITIGGKSLALYENSSGRRAIAVVFDSTGVTSSALQVVIFKGMPFLVKNINYKYTLGVKKGTDTSASRDFLPFFGDVVGLSDNDMLDMFEVTLPSVDAEQSYSIGGTPMLARQYNGRWYMVVHEVA